MTRRFTLDGSEALELHLDATCRAVAAGVRKLAPSGRIEGLLLGGGYGRGEGGVLRTPAGDQPYNDLEFYLFLSGHPWINERRHGMTVHHLAEQLTPEAGVEVEIKIISRRKLQASPVTMFYYDLVMGHRRFLGEENLLDGCGHHRQPEKIPLHEATRLLMNRCSGLLFASEKMEAPQWNEEAADFVGRNLAKAQLGFGDVFLCAQGQYHWSCRERNRRLQHFVPTPETSWLPALQSHHSRGVAFKLHPQRRPGKVEDFRREFEELKSLGSAVWLWLESKRLQQPFDTLQSYVLSKVNKCPERGAMRNRLVNLKSFGPGLHGDRYPRERLLNSLPVLLWEPQLLRENRVLAPLQSALRSRQQTVNGLLGDYRSLWRQYN